MSVLEIFLIGIALSMDAFAVSISDGLLIETVTPRKALAIATTFGGYQFLMPTLGYLGAAFFYKFIAAIDHWIAFFLLCFLGGKMIVEGVREKRQKTTTRPHTVGFISFKTLMVQGIATSIDALAVGISFAAMPTLRATYLQTLFASAVYPALLIGLTTTCLCLPAVFIGKKTGEKCTDRAQLLGGALLVAIGVKIVVEHVFFGG